MKRIVAVVGLSLLLGGNAFAMGFLGGGGGGSTTNVSLDQSLSLIDSIQVVETGSIGRVNSSLYLQLDFLVNNGSDKYIWAFAVGLPSQWGDNEGVITYPNNYAEFPFFSDEGWIGFDYWKSAIVPVDREREADLKAYLDTILGSMELELSDELWNSILEAFSGYPYAYLAYFAVDAVDGNGNLLYPYHLILPGSDLGSELFGLIYQLQTDLGSPFLVLGSDNSPDSGQDITFSFGIGETSHPTPSQPNSVVPEPASLALLMFGLGFLPRKRQG